MRISCQVLRQIESLKGEATTAIISDLLPELDKGNISSIISALRRQGRVYISGEVKDGQRGRRFKFAVNPDWERPPGPNAKARKESSGSPLSGTGLTRVLGVVQYKKEKIAYLKSMMRHAHAEQRVILVSMLEDYGVKYDGPY
jgi:hypothetical protein